jgi:hypothetical protein
VRCLAAYSRPRIGVRSSLDLDFWSLDLVRGPPDLISTDLICCSLRLVRLSLESSRKSFLIWSLVDAPVRLPISTSRMLRQQIHETQHTCKPSSNLCASKESCRQILSEAASNRRAVVCMLFWSYSSTIAAAVALWLQSVAWMVSSCMHLLPITRSSSLTIRLLCIRESQVIARTALESYGRNRDDRWQRIVDDGL